ncbi:MAG: alpha-1,2-fucosyltransferase [Flavobacteriaceae bacterium]|jgi:hypothetical protein|nr:alpha-1,2-fucosyltransferase [Flavobacteriaceae bacterium]MBT6448154.1 alpha-1,2-fucosyltransferase [Flavobacteriaceae bacterium]
MKQVSLRLKGGLGNQLFIYSFGKMLEKKYKFKIKYDLTTGFIINEYKHIETIKPLLKFYFDDVSEISFFSLIFHQIARKINYPRLFNIQYINEEFDNLEEHLNNLSNTNYNYYLEGYFQSYPLLENILPDIKSNINLDYFLGKNEIELCKRIKNINSVAIQIRVNDYPVEYNQVFFKKAIRMVLESVEDPQFYLFSDNPEWCHKNLDLPNDIFTINTGSDMKDFAALASCNNFILSVGTFGWWGAMLSQNIKKIVVYPKVYKDFIKEDFYPKEWIDC